MSSAGQAPAIQPMAVTANAPAYTEFHPRWYRRQVSTYWWMGNWPYVKFILRELSSVAVAWTVAVTLFQLAAINGGASSYANFAQYMRSPWLIVLNAIAFAFLLLHSITWFNLAPKAMAVRLQGKRVPAILISGPQFLAWLVISGFVLWMYLRATS